MGDEGFSLLETLAAVAILALASGVAVAALPPGGDPREDEALAFAAKLERAADDAVLSGLVVGVDVDADGYRFRRRIAGAWRDAGRERAFAAHAWSEGAQVEVAVEGGRGDPRRWADLPELEMHTPRLRLDPTGVATPAEVRIAHRDASYLVRLAADGAVAVEASDAR